MHVPQPIQRLFCLAGRHRRLGASVDWSHSDGTYRARCAGCRTELLRTVSGWRPAKRGPKAGPPDTEHRARP